MPYTTPAEVKLVLAAVQSETDDDFQGTPAELSDAIIQLHIEDAEAQVNTALNDKYPVPFADPPHIIKAITRAFAAYFADLTYRKSRAFENNDYPAIRRYNWAQQQLDMIRTGKTDLNVYDSDGSSTVFHAYDGPLFTQSHYLGPREGDYEVHWLWEVS